MNCPAPNSLAELTECVRSNSRVLAIGTATKPRLSQVDETYTRVSLLQLRGITEHQPEEYTLTALAGTPLRELSERLGEQGQYLPFDPMLARSGATLGGTIAAGLSGAGRFRYGGIRDFILGVRFVDGEGRVLRLGGKVVKNAAGFDLPKFFVGSLGRFGVLAEITLKVFPQAISSVTLRLRAPDPETALSMMTQLSRSRYQPESLDLPPGGDTVCVRLAGPAEALNAMGQDILARWPGERLSEAEAAALWASLAEIDWAHRHGVVLKIPLVPTQMPALVTCLRASGGLVHVSSGGNVAFASLPSPDAAMRMESALTSLGLSALTLWGTAPLWLGAHRHQEIARSVKAALDPLNRFPPLED
jgi:glycolate oxidase FAD binding subunit